MTLVPLGVRADVAADGVARLRQDADGPVGWAAAVHATTTTKGVRVLVIDPVGPLPAEEVDALVAAVRRAPQPVVAVLDGALTGAAAAVALAADLRVWGDAATLHVRPWDGGAVSWTLTRLVGHGRAADLLLRPRPLTAREAADLGLATVVAGDVEDTLRAVCADLAVSDGTSLAAVKRALEHAAGHDAFSTLEHEAQRRAMLARLLPPQA